MRRVRILDQASEEAIEAAAWYERERPGLGIEFGEAINLTLDLLEEDVVPLLSMPGLAGTLGAKRIILRRFPYDVVVRSFEDEVLVVAIAHHARRPGYWRNRIEG